MLWLIIGVLIGTFLGYRYNNLITLFWNWVIGLFQKKA